MWAVIELEFSCYVSWEDPTTPESRLWRKIIKSIYDHTVDDKRKGHPHSMRNGMICGPWINEKNKWDLMLYFETAEVMHRFESSFTKRTSFTSHLDQQLSPILLSTPTIFLLPAFYSCQGYITHAPTYCEIIKLFRPHPSSSRPYECRTETDQHLRSVYDRGGGYISHNGPEDSRTFSAKGYCVGIAEPAGGSYDPQSDDPLTFSYEILLWRTPDKERYFKEVYNCATFLKKEHWKHRNKFDYMPWEEFLRFLTPHGYERHHAMLKRLGYDEFRQKREAKRWSMCVIL